MLKFRETQEKEDAKVKPGEPRLPSDSMNYLDRKIRKFSKKVDEVMFGNTVKTGKLKIDNDDIDKAFEEALKQEIAEINKDRSN